MKTLRISCKKIYLENYESCGEVSDAIYYLVFFATIHTIIVVVSEPPELMFLHSSCFI